MYLVDMLRAKTLGRYDVLSSIRFSIEPFVTKEEARKILQDFSCKWSPNNQTDSFEFIEELLNDFKGA